MPRRTALITGASSGIGAEFARQLAADGLALVLVARNTHRLAAVGDELRASYGVPVRVVTADLSLPDAAAHVMTELASTGTEIDILVNNAGFGTTGAFADANLRREVEMVDLNVRALVDLTGRLLPSMIARGRGHVLNVASGAGFLPGPYMATYYASKAFVVSFTEAISHELSGTGVTATALCPGPSATGFAGTAGAENTSLFRPTHLTTAADVARAGLRAMAGRRVIAFADPRTRASVTLLRLMPRAVIRRASARTNRPRPSTAEPA